jgi:glycosyltransferase involved in cell wall biosynthesis
MVSAAGMENHLLLLLPALRAHGLNVQLMVMVEPDKPMTDYLATMRERGVPAEAMLIRRDLDLGLIMGLARWLRRSGAAVLHTHLIHADLHGLAAAKLAGVRHVISSGHNDDSFRKLLPIRLVQAVFWRHATAGIAISESLRQFIIRTEAAPAHKIHTVRYGLDPAPQSADASSMAANKEALRQSLNLSPTAFIFGSVSRLVTQKGLSVALQAFATALAEVEGAATLDPHYVIVGDGPLRDALTAEARALGLEARVHFLGWRADARALYAAFDAFLMPSLWEGFGLVALEAMAARLPIVASAVSALPEIVVDGETGYLSPPTDVAALAARLLVLLNDPARGVRMGEAGRERLERVFSVARMVEATTNVYAAYAGLGGAT